MISRSALAAVASTQYELISRSALAAVFRSLPTNRFGIVILTTFQGTGRRRISRGFSFATDESL